MARPTALLVVGLALAIAPASAAQIVGGGACTLDIHCGWAPASVFQLRDQSASSTGKCEGGRCVCSPGFGCSHCHAQLLPGSGSVEVMNDGVTKIDKCNIAFGGGACKEDSHCGDGLCLGGQCVCTDNWACDYCTMDWRTDIKGGATCGMFSTGRGKCSIDAECTAPHGKCEKGLCKCNSGYTCAHCSLLKDAVKSRQVTCPCTGVDCSGHGNCAGGNCVCEAPYGGPTCSFDPCGDVDCSGHGKCQSGGCVCDEGYKGKACDEGGGLCESNVDCGYFGKDSGGNMLTGGICKEDGSCECYPGFTCSNCAGVGATCKEAVGGAKCNSNIDCGFYPDRGGTGGSCIDQAGPLDDQKYWRAGGICKCFQGFACPGCNLVAEWMEDGDKCPPPPIEEFGAAPRTAAAPAGVATALACAAAAAAAAWAGRPTAA